MTSIENSRTLRFSKYFPNHAEYTSKVRRPFFAQVYWKKKKKQKVVQTEREVLIAEFKRDRLENVKPSKSLVKSFRKTKEVRQINKRSETELKQKTKNQDTNTESVLFVDKLKIEQSTVCTQTEIPFTEELHAVRTDKEILDLKHAYGFSNPDLKVVEYNENQATTVLTETELSENRRTVLQEKDKDHLHTESDQPSHSPSVSHDFDLWSILNQIKLVGDPRIVLSLYGAYDKEHNIHWNGHARLIDALTKIGRCAGRCGFIYSNKDSAFVEGIMKVNMPLKGLSDVEYGFFSCDPERYETQEKTDKKKIIKAVKMQSKERHGFVFYKNRLMVETSINKYMTVHFEHSQVGNNVRVPVVLLLVNGDLAALEHVFRAIKDDISVVVLKGSGGAADLIALSIEDIQNIRKYAPLTLATRFEDKLYSNFEEVLTAILEKDWLVTIFDLNVDSDDTLWDKITDGIMRAWSFEQNKDLEDDGIFNEEPIFKGDDSSISEYVVDIPWLSKPELFGGYNVQQLQGNELQAALYNCLLRNDTYALRLLLNKYGDLSLTMVQLKGLYQQLFESKKSKKNTKLNIWQYLCPDACHFLSSAEATSNTGFHNAQEAAQSISNKLLKGLCFSKVGLITCCNSLRKRNKDLASADIDDLLLRYLHSNDIKVARELWVKSKNPMLTALMSSCFLCSAAEKEDERLNDPQPWFKHSRVFAKRAEYLLDMLFEHEEDMATDALEHVTEVWGHAESALHFARQFNLEEFIAHSTTQKEVNKRLYAYKSAKEESDNPPEYNETTTKFRVKHDPDYASFIRHHWENKRPWKCLTAPITRINIQFVIFLASLIMFSIFLCTDLNVGTVSELEVIVFVLMVGDFVEELLSMFRCGDECRWSQHRIFLHLFDIWNFMDILCIILYCIGFIVHWNGSEYLIAHIRRLYSIALFVMFLRTLNIFLFFLICKKLGIIVIMLKEMLVDLWKYLVILFVLILAAGLVYHANIYPNHTLTIGRIRTVLKIPYWQLYGELNLDTLEGSDQSCTDNVTVWSADPTVERCPEGDWIASFIAAFYVMLTNWLLLSIVIAMFRNHTGTVYSFRLKELQSASQVEAFLFWWVVKWDIIRKTYSRPNSRYQKVKEKSQQKWRYHRHSVIINYEHWIPSPFNFVIRPVLLVYKLAFCPCYKTKKGDMKTMLEKQKEFAFEIIIKEINESQSFV